MMNSGVFHGHRLFVVIASLMLGVALPSVAEVIKIGGTGSAVGTMTLLGQAFEKAHPAHAVKIVPALGSSGGIKALQAGALQVAVSNRDVSAEEKATGLVVFKYGKTPFVFVTHAKVPAFSLTKEKLAAIYDGRDATWPNGQTIRLVLRPPSDADNRQIMLVSPEMEAAVAASHKRGLVVAMTDDDAADQIEKTPSAFGVSTLALVISEGRNLNVLALDGVKPTVAALGDGSYKLAKDIYAITPAAPSAGVAQFIQFLRSAAAQDILKKNGHKVD